MSTRAITVMTHGRPAGDRAGRCASSRRSPQPHGAVLALDAEETAKHALVAGRRRDRARRAGQRRRRSCASRSAATARSCARCAPTPAPACPCSRVNFGQVGFLATVEPERDARGVRARARRHARRRCACRRSSSTGRPARHTALNDVSLHRKVGGRVAELSYAVGGEEVGSVRCDGLVVATPGGLDRLQPRQRRPGDGVGRRGHGRLVHRAALAQRARAGDRARRRADAAQQLARGARGLGRRAPGRRDRARRRSCARGSPHDVATLAQMDGLELLPPPAREVRRSR